jgi:hypothetical protein
MSEPEQPSDYQSSAPEGFQPPPPPPMPEQPTGPQMSVGETLTGIFFEPGKTFESLRARPRFLIAALICTIFVVAFFVTFYQRVGFERVMREAIESSSQADQLSAAQKEEQVRIQSLPIVKAITYVSPAIVMAISFALGGALYLLGSAMMGGRLGYKQAIAVWVYSSLPPTVLAMLLNIILLFIRSPDDYDIIGASRRGLVQANLSFLVDAKAAPVLATLLGSFDVFTFYGLFLGALGLRLVGKLSSGSAWGIVLAIWIISVVLRIGFAVILGSAM